MNLDFMKLASAPSNLLDTTKIQFGPPETTRPSQSHGVSVRLVKPNEPRIVVKTITPPKASTSSAPVSETSTPTNAKPVSASPSRQNGLSSIIPSSRPEDAGPSRLSKGTNEVADSQVEYKWKEVTPRYRPAPGLINPSMACFSNAINQVLFHTPAFLGMLTAHMPNELCESRWCPLCDFKRVAHHHWGTNRPASYQARVLIDKLNLIKKEFNKNRQADAHEYLLSLMDRIQNRLQTQHKSDEQSPKGKSKAKTPIDHIYGGEIVSRVICKACKTPSETFESVLDLSLDLSEYKERDLYDMLDSFTKEEDLMGKNAYSCTKCGRKTEASKGLKISKPPNILTLHIKRFTVAFGSGGSLEMRKNPTRVIFPERLDITPYTLNPQGPKVVYTLFGITCHHGAGLRFGHYTSDVKGPGGQWWHADDETVTRTDISEVRASNVYLLSYVRENLVEKPLPVRASQAGSSQVSTNGLDRSPLAQPQAGPSKWANGVRQGANGLPNKPTTIPNGHAYPLDDGRTSHAGPSRPLEPIQNRIPNPQSSDMPRNRGVKRPLDEQYQDESPPSKFTYVPKSNTYAPSSREKVQYHKPNPISASSFYSNPTRDSPVSRRDDEWSDRGGGKKKKHKKKHKEHGAPKPYPHMKPGGGSRFPPNSSKGMFKRMQRH